MKKQAGFTLIELVIVIIILGILAVTAAPKFLNLQDDAKKSAAQGVQAAVSSSAQLVYSKSALEGKERASSAVVTGSDGTEIKTVYGYPEATDDGIKNAVTIDGSWSGKASANNSYVFSTSSSKCTVNYTAASETSAAATTLNGCD
ncbi:prepilin-type N-terminal cleavage/methylation domain-containing protein [Aeromonas hydrophila]|jgi:MSHA pilin protein MshA|uniref:prepilin-type N-terminal cleavage/methylation domain-containing protein n=1 Tax=Aeromonas TaxID=642 RepID=UPI00002C0C1A|nr:MULTISPECIES: prepilin-type N-terminal cleavage/methylation domain-containing protein [Aeromonas]AZU46653.1 MSHA biogenesis protein MshA [Aeromonas hydrophila]EGX6954515.1 prepilin-type N-terminal cleavage/methylation domain-containing protein [Aeromonas hydrophila]EZH82554.1 MSHA biogenesis protein MshA [Aeromonas hydrophila AD9]MBL0574481.1 prepilin-type N-terminal cleavage/methylation domain-containing protein [Aeromonas hydrophila]MBQ4668566.1 prepilin-type N-terminal cleavage/methylati